MSTSKTYPLTVLLALFTINCSIYAAEEPKMPKGNPELYEKYTKPLEVPPGKLYSFEEFNKKEFEEYAQSLKPPKSESSKAKARKAKKKGKAPAAPAAPSILANNESFLCRMGQTVKYNVLENDLPKDGHLVITRITQQPSMGRVKIEGPNIVYTETTRKIGIDTFYYEMKDTKTGKTATGRVRVLVTIDWKNGKYNVGNDPNFFVPPSPKYKNKQMRNIYKFFRVGVKPLKGPLKGGKFLPEMAFPYATKAPNGKDTLPAGYIWNYPYDKYFVKGDPVMTAALGCPDLRIPSKYMKKYMFDLDIEEYTLSTKNHWRAFQKWGSVPDADRATWTGDVGFTLEDSDYNPAAQVRGRVKPYAYYKLTTYQGITGFFIDRRTPEQIKAGAPWKCIRVRVLMPTTLPTEGGRMKFSFDFWPFLQFMIDEKGWPAGYPQGGPIGNEVYNNPELSNPDIRPAGIVMVRNAAHWVMSDLPPKKPIKRVTLSPGKVVSINLKDIFALPMMRLPKEGTEKYKRPPLNPRFKIVSVSNKSALEAKVQGSKLLLKAGGSSKGHANVKVRCYDTFHQWYDDKVFPVRMP